MLHAAFIAQYDELQYTHDACRHHLLAALATAEATTQLPAEPAGGENLLAAAAEESVPLLSPYELRMAAALAIDIGVCPVSRMNGDGSSRCSINFGDMDIDLLGQILDTGKVSTAI